MNMADGPVPTYLEIQATVSAILASRPDKDGTVAENATYIEKLQDGIQLLEEHKAYLKEMKKALQENEEQLKPKM
jgi:hypothetical protein